MEPFSEAVVFQTDGKVIEKPAGYNLVGNHAAIMVGEAGSDDYVKIVNEPKR